MYSLISSRPWKYVPISQIEYYIIYILLTILVDEATLGKLLLKSTYLILC